MLSNHNLIRFGKICFGVALVLFAVEHFIIGDFISGRAPALPEGAPGKEAWAYVSGIVFAITGVIILLGRNARVWLVVSGLLVFGWALVRIIPVYAAHFGWGGELTQTGKAWTLWGGMWAVAALYPISVGQRVSFINQTNSFKWLGRICLGAFMVIAGIQHFLFIDFVKTLVPAWIPGDEFWSYFAAVALIAGGVGLWIPFTVNLAAKLSGAMIFVWFVVLHIPRAVAGWNDANEWIAVAEALAFSAVAFTLMDVKRGDSEVNDKSRSNARARTYADRPTVWNG